MAKVLPKPRLPQNATLDTVVDGLAEPEEYVRQVFAHMGRRRDNRQVRIGVQSDVGAPNYMIDEFMGDPEDPDALGQPVPMEAYNGRTHRELSFSKADDALSWSTVGMTWAEVQQLMGRIRRPGMAASGSPR